MTRPAVFATLACSMLAVVPWRRGCVRGEWVSQFNSVLNADGGVHWARGRPAVAATAMAGRLTPRFAARQRRVNFSACPPQAGSRARFEHAAPSHTH